jgi:hypothetical protein
MTGRLGTKCDGDFVSNIAGNFFVTSSDTDPWQRKPGAVPIATAALRHGICHSTYEL